ncbi:Multidrug resistance-associated protein 1 [Sorochytrium milnesiophthora]
MPTIMALVSFGVFTAFSWFSIIASPLSVLVNVLTNASQALTSYRRIVDFLNLPEIDPQAATIDRTSNSSADAITVQQGTFTWHSDAVSADRFALSDGDLVFPRRSLTAVIGRVGSGKSSLLYAILGEMHKRAGQVNVNGKIAYVAQQAWIINGTVRDNILFGSVYDEKRYRQTLEACSLMSDLAILEQGDMTPIGDKGVNLSDGQRARVSLARAVYADADIYLLDDCLSAVDAHVDKHIFTQVIGNQGLLAKKTVVLVTHGVHHLKHCDRVVMLNDGRISQQGSYDDLLAQEGGVQTLIADYAAQEEQDESAKSESDLGSDVVSARAGNTVSAVVDAEQLVALAAQPDEPVKGPADDSTTGTVGWPVYKAYISSMGKRNCLIYVVVFAGALGAHVSNQLWLKVLSTPPASKTLAYCIGIYGVITACVILMEGVHSYWSKVAMILRASRVLHHRLLTRVFRAPMYWLDSIPIGRVLNRFSSDIDIVDLTISKRWGNVATVCVGIAASSILIVQSSPWLLAILVAMFLILNFLKNFYLRTSRELFRISSACKAPMYQLSEEAVAGLVTIRAFAAQQLYATQIEAKIDPFVASFYIYDSVVKWLSLRVNIMGMASLLLLSKYSSFVMFAAALAAVVGRNTTSGQSAALAIINSNSLVMSLIILIENLCMVESSIVAVERIRGYVDILPSRSTLRDNLDPLGERDDAAVWKALALVNLREYVAAQEGKLQAEVKTGGSNFSASQKQLLTLATALLRKQRIVIFDEATSATDAETDAFVQRTIRSEFKDCTVLTIAHRLATIMDSDRILVLDKGCVSEFDSPANLLQNPSVNLLNLSADRCRGKAALASPPRTSVKKPMSSHLSPDQLQAKAASYPESPSQDQQQSQQQQQPSALERIASTISSTFSSAVNAIGHFTHHEQAPDDDANPPAVAQSGSSAEGYWDTEATSPSSPAAELKENAVDVYPNVSHQQLISSAMSGVRLDQDVHSSAASRARDDHQRGKDTHLGSTQSQDEDDKRDVQYIA